MSTRSPLRTPFRLSTLANRQTSRCSCLYVNTRSSPGLPSVAGSPSQISAALFAVGVPSHLSRQLSLTLSRPPTNHFAKGSFHCSTFFHGLYHTSSLFACFDQNLSGDLMESL